MSAKSIYKDSTIIVVFISLLVFLFFANFYSSGISVHMGCLVPQGNHMVTDFKDVINGSASEVFTFEKLPGYVSLKRLHVAEYLETKRNEEEEQYKIQNDPVFIYAGWVDEIVSEYYPSLNPLMIKAIIQNESRYNPGSVNSKTGVIGLMQVSPKWHTKRAENLGVKDLYDPYGNILVGCDILNEVYQTYGSMSYAINVYAGGYPYANDYIGSASPYENVIYSLMQGISDGTVTLGGD